MPGATKLFIGGITRGTTTQQLRDHFERYGRVLDCVAMREKDGRSRGFGYVTLDSQLAAECCLSEPQVIDGRVVDLKRAVPERVMSTGTAPNTRMHTPTGSMIHPVGPMREPLSPMGSGLPGTVDPVLNIVPTNPAVPDASMRVPNFGLPDAMRSFDASMRVPSSLLSVPACWSSSWAPALDCVQLLAASGTSAWAAPAGSEAQGLSASAPEFVPHFEAADRTQRTASDEQTRPVLGEITNKVSRAEDAGKAKPASKPEKKSSAACAFTGSENMVTGKKQSSVGKKKSLSLNSYPQADTDAIFQDSIFVDYDPDDLVLAYGMLPGLPPMQTTKLPSPLALPGSGLPVPSNAMKVAPPPGLELQSATSPTQQPEEELSPTFGQPLLSTTPTAASMPLRAEELSGLEHPCMQWMAFDNFSTTPTMAEAEVNDKLTVTLGTQTEEEAETEQSDLEERKEMEPVLSIRFSREDLLRLRGLVAVSGQSFISARRMD